MIRVEIRINKKTYWTFVIMLLIASLSGIYAVYLSDIEIDNILMQYTTLPLMLGMAHYAISLARKLIIDEPRIVLTNDYIEIYEFNEYRIKDKFSHYEWSDIKEIEVEICEKKEKYLLTIVTQGEKKSFSINGLEFKPTEIIELINKFR